MHAQAQAGDSNPLTLPEKQAGFQAEGNGIRLVVGASRGIGLALVQGQLRHPGVRRVIATHRPTSDTGQLRGLAEKEGGRLVTVALDVTSETSLEYFSRFLLTLEGGLDLAVHAAGILHEDRIEPEKSLDQCDPRKLMRLFEVNSIGPLMVAKALLPVQSRQRRFTFAALSAMVGSISDNRLGGWYGYRASKTALNQFIKTLANECRLKHPRAAIVAIHPGTTDTGLSRPFQRGVPAGKLYTPEQTATRILKVLDGMDASRSGGFFSWDGSKIPW